MERRWRIISFVAVIAVATVGIVGVVERLHPTARGQRLPADQVVVEFADTGAGIPPENLALIFEPYFTTKGDKGTGLGLAICRRIVKAHGGQIKVESEVGQGATFQVYLPRA